MKFTTAIDTYIADMRSGGRINSAKTEVNYRFVLDAHAVDVGNRDPRNTNRDDVKRTLYRWPNPNTQAARHAALTSFYDWAMEEGMRKDNPARQVRRARKQPTSVYRLTREEAAAMLAASSFDSRAKYAIHLGICAGLRSQELRGLQGRHFQRPGYIHVSRDIAKGKRERWVPVLADLQAVVAEIRETVGLADHVLPASHAGGGSFGSGHLRREYLDRPMSSQKLQTMVHETGRRAGIAAHIHPHLLRHAYGDHIAKYAGMRNAQFLLGHADIGTTQTYTGAPSLEELAASVTDFTFHGDRTSVPSLSLVGQSGLSGEGGIRTRAAGVVLDLRARLELVGAPAQWMGPLDVAAAQRRTA